MIENHPATASRHAAELEALQARFAHRVAARLDEQSMALTPDIGERLRFSRERAVERARAVRSAETAVVAMPQGSGSTGTLALGGAPRNAPRWWLKIAGVVPLIALVGGLVLIQQANSRAQIHAAAEVDSALLSDDLPPDAYVDPGFAEFLKAPHD